MDWRTRRALSALAIVGMLGLPHGAAAQSAPSDGDGNLRIPVRIDDKAVVQGALLKLAQTRATEVFGMSGVQIDWIDGRDANRLKIVTPYTILIMAEAPAKLKAAMDRVGTDVMGQGAPFIGRAYIYYDRVVPTIIPPRDIVTTLGDVMAHELGHLILPPGHSPTGIMRPSINMTSRRVETFTAAEAAEIRVRLRERARQPNTEPRTANIEPNMNTN
jgi:hypothetical protein